MKILVVGKFRSIVHWPENLTRALRETGCHVRHFAMNGTTPWQSLHYKIKQRITGDYVPAMCDDLAQVLAEYKPDRVIFIVIAALYMPVRMFELVRETVPHAISMAWVGDRLNAEEFAFASLVDHVAVTDSAFMDDLRQFGYQVAASYLPLAVDTTLFSPRQLPRDKQVIYAANNSPGRGALVAQINRPLTLYGKGWSTLSGHTPHIIHANRLPYSKLPDVYARSLAVLNIRNEKNVVNGLNQRSFEPYGCKTPVLNDDMPDLPLCFEPGKEILVWHSLDELTALYDRLLADPAWANQIGEAGYQRIMHQHTYQHRARQLIQLAN